jgi:hypothetical protein
MNTLRSLLDASSGAGAERYNIMLDAMREWFGRSGTPPAWQDFVGWARDNQWVLKRPASRDGWAMEQRARHPGWRIEWGPSQRAFMGSHEFRLRVDLPQLPDLQALVLDKPLLTRLDREVYQQFTDNVQTRFDDETPEEMRWLAMHAKLTPVQLGDVLRDRYGAIADDADWLAGRLAGPLADTLARRADATPLDAVSGEPFMLRLTRGQLLIRQGSPKPTVAVLQSCVDIALAGERVLARKRSSRGASS